MPWSWLAGIRSDSIKGKKKQNQMTILDEQGNQSGNHRKAS